MSASGGEVLGQRILTVFGRKLDIEIVGVVDAVFTDIRDAEPLALYLPIEQQAAPVVNRALVFRATNDVEAARREVVGTLRQLDDRLQVPAALTLDERLIRQMGPQQFTLVVTVSIGIAMRPAFRAARVDPVQLLRSE